MPMQLLFGAPRQVEEEPEMAVPHALSVDRTAVKRSRPY